MNFVIREKVSVRTANAAVVLPEDIDELSKKPTHRQLVLGFHDGHMWLRYHVHVLALIVTGGIAAINFLNIFLINADEYMAVTVLGLFQFAAKVHEGLLLGSAILLLLDLIRYGLLSDKGIPLGLLLSPFTFNNVDFVFSGQLWKSVTFTSRATRLSIVLLCAIVFANIAGPLSAITIVPRLGWSKGHTAAIIPHFFNASASSIWPERLSAETLPEQCSTVNAAALPGCPAYAIPTIAVRLSYAQSSGALCRSQDWYSSCNASLSTSGPVSGIPRLLSMEWDSRALEAYATVPNMVIYEILASRFEAGMAFTLDMAGAEQIAVDRTQLIEMKLLNAARFMKPAVATSCRDLGYAETADLLQQRELNITWSEPTVTWLDDAGPSGQETFMFTYQTDSTDFDKRTECQDEACFSTTVCTIDARWSPHDLWYNTAQQTLLFQSNPQPGPIFKTRKAETSKITLDKDWFELTALASVFNLTRTVVTLVNDWEVPIEGQPVPVDGIVQEHLQPTNRTQAIAIILASAIAEVLATGPVGLGESRYTGDCNDTKPGFTFAPEICAQDAAYWAHATRLDESLQDTFSMINFTVRKSGYGWFMLDSITLRIALGVLLFHALLTSVYLVYILMARRVITTRWGSASELLVLAIDSLRAPNLAGNAIKMADSSLWQQRVTIREVDDGDRLSLIVGNPVLYPERVGPAPELGNKYL